MNAPAPLEFAMQADSRLLTLVFIGRLLGDDVRKVRAEVDAAIEVGLPTLIDASGVSHMDSMGVALFVHVAKALDAKKLPVAVLPGPGPVARLLGAAQLDRYLNVAFSKAEALRLLGAVLLLLAIGLGAGRAEAQARPFLFTVTTVPPSPSDTWTVAYDAGYAERTIQAVGFEGVEQRVSVQGAVGAGFTVRGQFGVAFANGAGTRSSQEAELLKNILSDAESPGLAVGLGVRRGVDGTATLLGRVVVGHGFTGSWLYGNLRAEKSFETARDAVDLIVTAGWLFRVGSALHLGVETVAQDLEGLWEPEEAEGGARVRRPVDPLFRSGTALLRARFAGAPSS